MKKELIEFLKESNGIERVYDEDSLKQAIKAWGYLIKQKALTHEVILRTHEILMAHLLPKEDRGSYRKQPVWIGGRQGINYWDIRGAIDSWLLDIDTSIKVPGENGYNIKLDHVEYEKTHPFIDGNGRTGRMFMNWERLRAGLPLLVIKEAEKQKYYLWFGRN